MNSPSEHTDNEALQFDQFARYTVMSRILHFCFAPGEASLLDVGAGPSELTPRFLGKFYRSRLSTDVENFGRDDISVIPPGAPMPFADRQFDAAIAMDVLEHVRPEDRERFIVDMIRVARVAVIGTPIGCPETRLAESIYAAGHLELHGEPLTFLSEHTAYGLPESDTVLAIGRENGAQAFATDCAPLDEWLASNLIDLYLASVNDGYRVKGHVARQMNHSLPLMRTTGRHYRRFYVFTRDQGLASRLSEMPPPSQPDVDGWDARGAHLIMARIFRDYAAAYDAPFIDEERQASRDKDTHIEKLLASVRHESKSLSAERTARRQEVDALSAEYEATRLQFETDAAEQRRAIERILSTAEAEREEASARIAAFSAKPLLDRVMAAVRNTI